MFDGSRTSGSTYSARREVPLAARVARAAEGGPGGAARAEAAAAIRAAAPMVKRFSCRSRCSQSPNRTTRPVQNPGHRRRIHHRLPISGIWYRSFRTYRRRHTLGMWAAVVVAAAKADMADALEAAAAELRAASPAAPAAPSSAEVAWCKIQSPSRRQMLRRTRKGRRRHDSICGTCSSLGVPHRRSEE